MLIVGLTGGVASGKTTVSRVLKEEGAYIIDADQIARELVRPHTPAWKELIRAFGTAILREDGFIHRKKLADKVFVSLRQRKLLNQILHPRIRKEMERRAEAIWQKDPEAIVVVDAPLLVELGEHRQMDKVIVVTSTQTQQIERLKKRDGISPEEALRIFSSQMPVKDKVRWADFVIRNDGSFKETKKKAREVFKELRKVRIQTKKGREGHRARLR
jgi:dephospho-CoA kinase